MKNQESFLKGKYWGSEEFKKAAEQATKRTEKREGQKTPKDPEIHIKNYLKRFTDIFEHEDKEKKEYSIAALKRLLSQIYVVKSKNVSDEYIKRVLFGNFVERKGYQRSDLENPTIKEDLIKQFYNETKQSLGAYIVPKEERQKIQEITIQDQKARLNSWLDYLTSQEAENYPTAYRYWAFAEMLKLGSYDDKRKIYNKRVEATVAPFPELDQQALALVLDEIRRKQNNEPSQIIPADESSQTEFKKRLTSESFNRLYSFVQEHLKSLRLPTERLFITEGEWRVFPKGSNPKEVVKSIEGFHTQWCIAGEGTATRYLSHSDLHIYFSQDAEGKNSIPRASIVASKNRGITEIRGIMSDKITKQHLDNYIVPTVEERLSHIPGGEKWHQQMKNMKRLATIHIKYCGKESLSKEDLRFIYEIDGKIQAAGNSNDPRITEILKNRNVKDDISFILSISKEQISITKEEALSGNIKYHYGDLSIRGVALAKGLRLPELISGNLHLEGLTSAIGLELPESVGGNLHLEGLTSAIGLKLPESIGGSIHLVDLTSATGLKLPKSVNGSIDIRSLKSAIDLELPESVGGSIHLGGLTSAKGLKLPESVGGSIHLGGLTSAKGLKLPKSVSGSIDLRSLKSAIDLELPESIGGNLHLGDITSANGLKLPESVGGSIHLEGLTSAIGLELPKSVGGSIHLGGLTSAKGLKLPESIVGDINLEGLTSAIGLELPESISGNLQLGGLTSAKGLKLPKSVGGNLHLEGLTSAIDLKLPKSVSGSLYLEGLTSAIGLELPESIGESLYLEGLTSAIDLKLPKSVSGSIYFLNLNKDEKEKLRKQYPHLHIL